MTISIQVKAVKKKRAKEESNIFDSIIVASVKGNPNPKKAAKKKCYG